MSGRFTPSRYRLAPPHRLCRGGTPVRRDCAPNGAPAESSSSFDIYESRGPLLYLKARRRVRTNPGGKEGCVAASASGNECFPRCCVNHQTAARRSSCKDAKPQRGTLPFGSTYFIFPL